tara:strand:- start:3766 stop:3927 length:162 start_codon:yes stop_codon:yes gene_type:complete
MNNELKEIYKTNFNKLVSTGKNIKVDNLNKLDDKKINDIYKKKFEDLKNYLLK